MARQSLRSTPTSILSCLALWVPMNLKELPASFLGAWIHSNFSWKFSNSSSYHFQLLQSMCRILLSRSCLVVLCLKFSCPVSKESLVENKDYRPRSLFKWLWTHGTTLLPVLCLPSYLHFKTKVYKLSRVDCFQRAHWKSRPMGFLYSGLLTVQQVAGLNIHCKHTNMHTLYIWLATEINTDNAFTSSHTNTQCASRAHEQHKAPSCSSSVADQDWSLLVDIHSLIFLIHMQVPQTLDQTLSLPGIHAQIWGFIYPNSSSDLGSFQMLVSSYLMAIVRNRV